ncbi:MAG TPA: DUF1761 domain-containing protein [Gemmatimonadaceae bacterium]|nr:DUF1761 domain-containing protein [Gemmatimonadaceae bacterium]
MQFPAINYLAVLVSAIIMFALGGLWYSPALFAKRWIALQNKTEEQMRAEAASANMAVLYFIAFICAFLQAWVMAMVIGHMSQMEDMGVAHAAIFSALLWLGFAGATSYATSIFSGQPKTLWAINSFYNLVSFLIAGIILAVWR